ncbi:hypothetical protein WJX72_011890 [[Myrmecia] bisecta]|uniref:Uncharacterized protein n=1 Tax=[Myrmecia] bisecta TaxID=41462 RepID=A0AAW1R9M8_9CHLO
MQVDGTPPSDAVSGDLAASQQLRELAELVGIQPAPDSTAPQLLQAAISNLDQLLRRLGPAFFEPILSRSALNEDQLSKLAKLQADLQRDYTLQRQQMLLRAQMRHVTLLRSDDDVDGQDAATQQAASTSLASLDATSAVCLEDIFTLTRGDLAQLTCKSHASFRKPSGSKHCAVGKGQAAGLQTATGPESRKRGLDE